MPTLTNCSLTSFHTNWRTQRSEAHSCKQIHDKRIKRANTKSYGNSSLKSKSYGNLCICCFFLLLLQSWKPAALLSLKKSKIERLLLFSVNRSHRSWVDPWVDSWRTKFVPVSAILYKSKSQVLSRPLSRLKPEKGRLTAETKFKCWTSNFKYWNVF